MDWDTLALDARMSSMGRSTQVTLPRVSLLTLCSGPGPLFQFTANMIFIEQQLSPHTTLSQLHCFKPLTVLQNICDAKIVDNEGGEHVYE